MSEKISFNTINADETRDLGFGAVVARESRQRLLNRDGSFNVLRQGLSFWSSLSPYHYLLTISWGKFFLLVSLLYLAANALFACAYMLCGRGALAGSLDGSLLTWFLQAFFFSVQTFATIGYGHISPVGIAANLVVTLESLVGLLGFALATGLLFARFSRPTAKIIFSKSAVIAPYKDITGFQFRITNARKNQLIEMEANLLFTRFEMVKQRKVRKFYNLDLERSKVAFFPLSWTVVHPINEQSPLYQLTPADLQAMDAEFLILLTAIDETFSQTVHTRSSYKFDELVWKAKFVDIFSSITDDKPLTIDIRKLDAIEIIE
jgi:inward rectifier potassium channel